MMIKYKNRYARLTAFILLIAMFFIALPVQAASADETTIGDEVFADEVIVDNNTTQASPAAVDDDYMGVIILDPGHDALRNAGAWSVSGQHEEIYNARLAYAIGKALQGAGYTVYLTRRIDDVIAGCGDIDACIPYLANEYPFETARAYYAHQKNPDLYISIHHNAYNGAASGMETWWTTRQSVKSSTLAKSKYAATMINSSIAATNIFKNRGVKEFAANNQYNDGPLRYVKCPAALIEACFIDNASDHSKISQQANINRLASSVTSAVGNYFAKYPAVRDKTAPTIKSLALSEKSPTSKVNFTMRAKGVKDDDSGVKSVVFDVWPSGYTGMKKTYSSKAESGGNYSATFKQTDFKDSSGKLINGIYNIRARATDEAGNQSELVRKIRINGETAKPKSSGIEFVDQGSSTANVNFTVRANNVTDASGVSYVKFTIWRGGARDATKKIVSAKKASGDNWEYTFKLSDFGDVYGKYYFSLSAGDKRGNKGTIGSSKAITVENTDIMGAGEIQPQDMQRAQELTEPLYPLMDDDGGLNIAYEQLINYYIAKATPMATQLETQPETAFPLYYGLSLEEFTALYLQQAQSSGVNVEVAFAQAMEYTNFLRYDTGSGVNIGQYVFSAGLEGEAFATVEEGIAAQMAALAGSGQKDIAALGNKAYADKLLAMITEIAGTKKDGLAYNEAKPSPQPDEIISGEAPLPEPETVPGDISVGGPPEEAELTPQ